MKRALKARTKKGAAAVGAKRLYRGRGPSRQWIGFDDCPICRAVRESRADTMKGLLEAFREAKRSHPDRTFIVKDETS